jgi:hypothetical protein
MLDWYIVCPTQEFVNSRQIFHVLNYHPPSLLMPLPSAFATAASSPTNAQKCGTKAFDSPGHGLSQNIFIGVLVSLTLDEDLLFLVRGISHRLALALGRADLLLRRALVLSVVGCSSIYHNCKSSSMK